VLLAGTLLAAVILQPRPARAEGASCEGEPLSRSEIAQRLGPLMSRPSTKLAWADLPVGAAFRPDQAWGTKDDSGLVVVWVPARTADGRLVGFTAAVFEGRAVATDYAAAVDDTARFYSAGALVGEAPAGEIGTLGWWEFGCGLTCAVGCALSFCTIGGLLCFTCSVFCTWVCSGPY